jgi:hypothetical protein
MGTGPVPPGLLVTPAQLSRYNVPSAFLAQFALRPLEVQITTGGAIGTFAFAWRLVGDTDWSAPIASSAVTPWAYTIDDAFADLTFAAGNYVLDSIYRIDAAGNVTLGSGSPIAGLSAVLWDKRQLTCVSVTGTALKLMRDAIKAPLQSWDEDATMNAAAMVYALLKRGVGATPESAGGGDANVFASELVAIAYFESIGKKGKPDGWVDSSPSADGPLIAKYPFGATRLRGW